MRFGSPEEATQQAMAKVVSGVLILRAEVPMHLVGHMGEPVREAIARAVGLQESMVLTVVGSGSNGALREGRSIPMQDFEFKYDILAPSGTGEAIARTLELSVMGSPLSQFMMSLMRRMLQHEHTAPISVSGWSTRLPRPTVANQLVLRPPKVSAWMQTTPRLPPPTTTTLQPSAASVLQANFGDCWAFSRPCDCASLPACTWAQDPSGLLKCMLAADLGKVGGVSCSACPTQASCPGSGCGAISRPCECMESAFDCRWAEGSGKCVERQGGSTSCTACSKQPSCSRPTVMSYEPSSGTTLQLPQHLKVRVYFDRRISLRSARGASFACDGQPRPVLIPVGHLTVTGVELHVSVESILGVSDAAADGGPRDCSLTLDEGVIADQSGVPFAGTSAGTAYRFRLGDTVAPHVIEVDPANGGSSTSVSGVTFTFNERVFFSHSASLLDATFSSLDSLADNTEVAFPFEPPSVNLDGRLLSVDLSGETLQEGVLYTLSLPRAALVDAAGNAFEGLPARTYAFRAGVVMVHGEAQGGAGQLSQVTSLAAAAGGALAGVAICCYLGARAMRLRQARYLKPPPTKMSAVRPARPSQPYVGKPGMYEKDSNGGNLRRAGWAQQQFGTTDARQTSDGPGSPNSTFGSGTWESAMSGAGSQPFHNASGKYRPGSTGQFEAQSAWSRSFTWGGSTASSAPPMGRQASMPAAASSRRAASVGAAAGRRSHSSGPATGNAARSSAPGAPRPSGMGGAASSSSARPPSSSRRSSSEGPPGRPPGHNANATQEEAAGSRSSSRVFMATATVKTEEGEVNQKKLELERRLRDLMSKPLSERKKVLRELMLEYHPDKNSDPNATEIFQFINASRGWFLSEP